MGPALPPAPAPEGPSRQDQIRAGLERGARAHEHGAYEQAIAAYRSVLALDPGNSVAGQGLRQAQRARDAETSAFGGSQGVDDLVRRGEQLLEQGKYQEAIEAFQTALQSSPNNAPARQGLRRAQSAMQAEEKVFGKTP